MGCMNWGQHLWTPTSARGVAPGSSRPLLDQILARTCTGYIQVGVPGGGSELHRPGHSYRAHTGVQMWPGEGGARGAALA